MKKIGIITLSGKHNYGNRLQNYALQATISSLSGNATTLIEKPSRSMKGFMKSIARCILQYTPLYRGRKQYKMKKAKLKIFSEFDSKYTHEDILTNDNEYDLFLAGSDQVWNPKFAAKDFHFLAFAPPEKRFSYAASFGVSEIPLDQQEKFINKLAGFKRISVREDDGKKIVEKYTSNKDIMVVPDPTMLLSRNDWDDIAKVAKPVFISSKKYIVIYALHDFSTTNIINITNYANKNNYEIYQIMGDVYNRGYKIPSPNEFVWLIAHAEAVFTDSFHCCAFSIIYHTPFIVFDRTDGQKMTSRIETLTKKFNLAQAMIDRPVEFSEIFASEDFSKTDKILEDYRDIGIRFLKEVINS